jgi:hypothetical protein
VAVGEPFNWYAIGMSVGKSFVSLGGFIERGKDGLWIAEIVVNHVDERIALHHVLDQCLTGGALIIQFRPLHSELKCLVLQIILSMTIRLIEKMV